MSIDVVRTERDQFIDSIMSDGEYHFETHLCRRVKQRFGVTDGHGDVVGYWHRNEKRIERNFYRDGDWMDFRMRLRTDGQ